MTSYIVEAKGHLIDDVEVSLTAEDLTEAEDEALNALKDFYPEYDTFDILDVKEVVNG